MAAQWKGLTGKFHGVGLPIQDDAKIASYTVLFGLS